ncbi:MAG: DUF2490 domain-containing protein [Lentisphaerae bacterium]|nr:DUF2490 domain-containing protein [Lentisphaerota bacterium]
MKEYLLKLTQPPTCRSGSLSVDSDNIYKRPLNMKIRLLPSAVVILVALAANANVWIKGVAEGDIWGNAGFTFEQEAKIDERQLYNEESLFLLNWKVNSWLKLAAGYRLVFERNDEGRFDHENRPTFDATFSSPKLWTMHLDLRTRFEIRKKERTSPYLRQRSRLRLRTSWSVTDFRISPFAFEEAFFSFKQNDETRNCFDRLRSAVGVSFRPIPSVDSLQCLLFYMVQHGVDGHASEWDPASFVGIEMRYSF